MTLTIGIDVGGTKVLGGVVDESGNILEKARRDTPRQGGSELTKTIAEVALELMHKHKVSAVGVSAAGFVSSDRKTMLATPNIAGWNGVNLDDELTQLIGTDVVIENDANAAALSPLPIPRLSFRSSAPQSLAEPSAIIPPRIPTPINQRGVVSLEKSGILAAESLSSPL